ncbi:tyrosine-type recombinase/integrase, partial [Candidatus Anaplasma sp. TIGMIC]|nr:tyrosine-type recombinase/integrase [Candidatus Anaplasma sp. TIGMIC]
MDGSDLLPVVEDWLRWMRDEKGYSSNTIEAYERDAKGFLATICSVRAVPYISLSDISGLHISEFRKWLALRCKTGKNSTSNARAISVLRNFFRYLHLKCNVSNQAVFNIASPISRKSLPKVLVKSQALKIINEESAIHWTSMRDAAMAALLYGCGLRVSEAVELRMCDLASDELRVIGKGKKERVVPILPCVKALINGYIKVCPYRITEQSLVFVGMRGNPLSRTHVAHRMREKRR